MEQLRIDRDESIFSRLCRATIPNIAGILVFLAVAVSSGIASARQASIVIEANSGRVLQSLNADDQVYPASLTKMMTLYLLFEAIDKGRLKLDQRLAVSEHAAARPPTGLGLVAGQTITVRDAMLGLITKSANDAAAVVGEAIGGSEAAFAQRMTQKARALAMTHTVFQNASGLPDPEQVTTARDMAHLGRALLADFPHHYQVFSTLQFRYGSALHTNHNRLLGKYDGLDGIKTGYIRASGFNLVASAERDGVRLIGVVMGGRTTAERNQHMVNLLDRAFNIIEPLRANIAGSPLGGSARLPSGEATAAHKSAPAAAPVQRKREAKVGPWAIQVGAFKAEEPARGAAERAMKLAPKMLSGSQILVRAEATKQGQRVFRARLVGLSEEQARQACSILGKRNQACKLIPPGETNLAFSELAR